MSASGEKANTAYISKQDPKPLHETETGMKHFISKTYSGLKEVSLRTYIFQSQNGQHIYWFSKTTKPPKTQHTIYWLNMSEVGEQLSRINFLPFTGQLA